MEPGSPEILIGEILRNRKLRLVTAESCTGGLIASRLTDVPGSSVYFLGGVVAYAYELKVGLLGVAWETLQRFGAVSRETVLEMAHGARQRLGADIAVAVSGIAGPGGGTAEKPVGTTWLGLETPAGARASLHQLAGSRTEIKAAAAEAALEMVLDYLQGQIEE